MNQASQVCSVHDRRLTINNFFFSFREKTAEISKLESENYNLNEKVRTRRSIFSFEFLF